MDNCYFVPVHFSSVIILYFSYRCQENRSWTNVFITPTVIVAENNARVPHMTNIQLGVFDDSDACRCS